MKLQFPKPTRTNCWFLENDSVCLAVEKSTGLIRSLVFKDRQVDLFQIRRQNIPGHVGYLRVFDERDGRWYHDLHDRFRVTKAAKRGNTITLAKRFAGAPFVLTITLAMEGEFLRWEVRAEKAGPKVADRSLRVGFNFPLQAGWEVWAPCRDGQFAFDGLDDFNFNHVQVTFVSPREVILPMVSHFSRQLDVGYSILEPMDAKVPAARFQFENGEKLFTWGYARKRPDATQTLEALNYYVGLIGKRPMTTRVMLTFHEGDWRPGLGAVYRRWREYFDPDSPAIYDFEGVFNCGGVEIGQDPQWWVDMGLKTLEVHGHFHYYSDYFQEGKDKWLRIGILEGIYRHWRTQGKEPDAREVWEFANSRSDEEIADLALAPDWRQKGVDLQKTLYHTRDNIRRLLQNLRDAGIFPFWYFNYNDGFRPVADERWPDAICRDQDGKAIPSGWHMSHNLNADLATSYGKFCDESIPKILRDYPALVGFFLDCFRHYEVDFAHDDGVTVVDHKPAYSVNFSYDALTARLKEHMRATGRPMAIFANKPQTIRCMRHVDGVLLEGGGDQAEEKYFWACIARPNFFMWTSTEGSVDENLRRAVVHGCFPKVAKELRDTPEQAVALYRRYLPLYEQFRRRVLCFEPDPLRVPRGSRGKLYTLPDGYVAGIANVAIDSADELRRAKTPYALFRVSRGWDVGRVALMFPGDAALRDVKFMFYGSIIGVPLPGYLNCAVVRLFVTKDTGKPIGPERFTGPIDHCGDPESSFQDISDR